MEAEDVALDNGAKWKVIEQAGEVLPHVGIAIFTKALVVETIHLCDLL